MLVLAFILELSLLRLVFRLRVNCLNAWKISDLLEMKIHPNLVILQKVEKSMNCIDLHLLFQFAKKMITQI